MTINLQPNQQFYVQDIHNPPNIPIDFSLSSYGQRIVGYVISSLIGEVQKHINSNDIRNYGFNVLSDNFYNNDVFKVLINSTLKYVEAMVVSGSFSENTAFSKAINELVAIYCSKLAKDDHQFFSFLDQYTQSAIIENVRKLSEIKHFIQSVDQDIRGSNMQNPNQQQPFPPQGYPQQHPQMMGPQQPMMSPQGYPQPPQMMGPQQQQPMSQQGFPPQGYPQQPMMRQGYPQQPQPQPMQNVNNTNSFFSGGNQGQPMVNTNQGPRKGSQRNYGKRNTVSMSEYENYPNSAVQKDWKMNQVQGNQMPPNFQPKQVEVQEMTSSELDFPGDNTLVNGLEMNGFKIHPLKNAKLLFRGKMPKPPVFDYTKQTCVVLEDLSGGQLKFDVVDTQDLKEKGLDAMNYDDHEVTRALKGSIPDDGDKVVPLWETLFTEEEKKKEEEIQEKDFTSSGLYMVKSNVISSDDDYARLEIGKKLIERGKIDIDFSKSILEYSYLKTTPIVIDNNLAIIEQFFDRISSIDSIERFVHHLNSVNRKGIDKYFLSIVVERATKILNRILSVGMSLSVSIDNILEDWYELEDYFIDGNTFTLEEGKALFDELNEQSKEISQCVRLLDDKQRAEFFNKEELDKDIYKDKFDNLVLLGEVHYTSRVPWSSSDLTISLGEKGSVVRESIAPKLFKAVKGIVQRSEESKNVTEIHLLLSDGVKLILDTGLYSKDHYVLTKA